MTDKFLNTIAKYQMIPSSSTVGIGLSGGADSVALLHLFVTNKDMLGISHIKAIHIHHGIRGNEADRDLEFSKQLCEKLHVEFVSCYADVPAEAERTGESVEECARRIRYDYFSKSNCDIIATAHNLNDNMETVIFNLARGTSLTGLCGIPYVRDCYIRPLLDCSRAEVDAYIQGNSLDFVTDSTNLCDDYTRNKIRHNIIPQLFEINPSFTQNFANFNDSMRLANDYILQSAVKVLEEAKDIENNEYNCKMINACHDAVKNQVIKLILEAQGVRDISRKHINSIAHIIKVGGKSSLGDEIVANSDRYCLRFKELNETEHFEIYVKNNASSVKTPVGVVKIETFLKENLQLLDKLEIKNAIDCDKISGELVIRNKCEGDFFKPVKRVNKKLKKLFIEENIPIYKRSRMIILADEQGIVWTEYFGVAERCKIDKDTSNGIKVSVWEE